MAETWFLGANSARGFASLYTELSGGLYLHIIKGGPGTGKSTLMRGIGEAAEAMGYDAEYILCSGDPDSLDAVIIPSLKLAWADGTAPHALEPGAFGADGDYIDLGRFCALPEAKREEVFSISSSYRRWYARAYELLAAAERVSPSMSGWMLTEAERRAARERAAGAARRELHGLRPGEISRRYLGSLTCKGRCMVTETLASVAPRLYLLDNELGLGWEFTSELARRVTESGVRAVICPHWLAPDKIEAVLLPESGVGWCVLEPGTAYPAAHRRLHLDRMADAETRSALRTQLRADAKLCDSLLTRAGQCLAAAKSLHDRLEAQYRPHLDTQALKETLQSELTRLPRKP